MATSLSSSTWRRLRRALTAGLFVATTVAGVTVGLDGAAVSPVAPVPAAAVSAADPAGVTPPVDAGSPTTDHQHGAGIDHRPHR